MKQYVSPKAELIVFQYEMITAVSGCDCHYDITNQSLVSGSTVACEGESGGAYENPFGIRAPSWTFGT